MTFLLWEPTGDDGLGELFGLGIGFDWKKPTDLPDDEKIDFETAVEITALEFPPQVAIRRKIR